VPDTIEDDWEFGTPETRTGRFCEPCWIVNAGNSAKVPLLLPFCGERCRSPTVAEPPLVHGTRQNVMVTDSVPDVVPVLVIVGTSSVSVQVCPVGVVGSGSVKQLAA